MPPKAKGGGGKKKKRGEVIDEALANKIQSKLKAVCYGTTPQRVSACARANARADDALRRFHECAAVPNASVDGALRDVVDLSLAAEEVCAVDEWEKAE